MTNHTGRNLAGKPTIDVLFEAKNVKLVPLFAPEHGIRGELDIEKIDDTKDEKTGLPVYSLYKDGMRRPKPEQLKDLDAIVYDIQDIGARFYTYTATLKNVMEEAAKLGKPVYVLDRPNPINGNDVEGSLAEEDKLSFIAAHTIPVRYGLTIGELGQMMNAERKIGADLRVIKMEDWSRAMWFDETGQTWVNPSPNMRSLTEATLYPGIGLLETTNLSVGRGTDTPFEVIGAPWLDGQKLAKYLNERSLPGVRFIPVRFKPNASVFKDEELGGVNIVITDRKAFQLGPDRHRDRGGAAETLSGRMAGGQVRAAAGECGNSRACKTGRVAGGYRTSSGNAVSKNLLAVGHHICFTNSQKSSYNDSELTLWQHVIYFQGFRQIPRDCSVMIDNENLDKSPNT